MRILYFLLLSISCFSNDFDFSPNHQKIYGEVFKFKTPFARKLLEKENPNKPFSIFLQDRIETIELLNSEDRVLFEKLKQNEDLRLEKLDKFEKNSPYFRLLQAEIKLNWALLKIRFGHEVKAAWNVISAYKLLEENQRLFPNFLPNNKSLGGLHVLIGSVPENYNWVLKILGLSGDVKKGMAEIHAASNDKIWGLEAKYFEFFMKAYVLKFDDKSNHELMQVIENQQDNLNFQFLATAISRKENKTEQANQILKIWSRGDDFLAMPIEYFYWGEINLFNENYKPAIANYLKYLKEFRGTSFRKDAHYKLSLAAWFSGDESLAKSYLSRIGKVGNTFAESDKAAQKFYENYQKTNAFPNLILMKARLAFDGGFYTKSLKILENQNENSFQTQKDKAEFRNRMGRIRQKLNQNDLAIIEFQRAIELSGTNDWYFAPTSALQLGYIFQSKNQKDKAKFYFEKAISYKNHEYKNSTDNKAKAGLNELGVRN